MGDWDESGVIAGAPGSAAVHSGSVNPAREKTQGGQALQCLLFGDAHGTRRLMRKRIANRLEKTPPERDKAAVER